MYERAIQEKLVTQLIQVPNDFLITVPLETGFIRNKGTSQVMVLEYSDYQCPACRMVQPMIAQLRQKLDKKVAFAYRHFPLSFHTEADEASLAVECGREQGSFEKFHQYFYENQAALGKEKARVMDYLKSLGKELKIDDPEKFERCLDNEKYRDLVRNDINTGMEIGISGTPAFIVGKYDPETKKLHGELLTGGMPVAEFEKLINKYM
jgi:protein-disulfide isomerase